MGPSGAATLHSRPEPNQPSPGRAAPGPHRHGSSPPGEVDLLAVPAVEDQVAIDDLTSGSTVQLVDQLFLHRRLRRGAFRRLAAGCRE